MLTTVVYLFVAYGYLFPSSLTNVPTGFDAFSALASGAFFAITNTFKQNTRWIKG